MLPNSSCLVAHMYLHDLPPVVHRAKPVALCLTSERWQHREPAKQHVLAGVPVTRGTVRDVKCGSAYDGVRQNNPPLGRHQRRVHENRPLRGRTSEQDRNHPGQEAYCSSDLWQNTPLRHQQGQADVDVRGPQRQRHVSWIPEGQPLDVFR
jgi:hypothetical protein